MAKRTTADLLIERLVGHHVLISPQWIEAARWSGAKVMVDLTCQAVRDSPPYDAAAQLDRQQEEGMYEHYGRRGYWDNDTHRGAGAPPHRDINIS